MINRLLKKLIPYPGVRRELRVAQSSLSSAINEWRNELTRGGNFEKYAERELKLNIGCGSLVHSGWLNVDFAPGDGAHYMDVRNGLPFSDESVKHIHCEHFIEHLDYYDARKLFVEFYRVTEPGGSLRIIVPDAEKYCRAYVENNKEFFEQLKDLGGTPEPFESPMQVINQMFRMEGAHKFAWDYDTLLLELNKVGFTDVARSHPHGVSGEHDIDGDDWWREVESLYVNVSKS